MKKNNLYKYSLLAWLVAIQIGGFAQFKDDKTYDKAVAAPPDSRISILNKQGDIKLISWDKDSVVVNAVIRGESKSLVKLQ